MQLLALLAMVASVGCWVIVLRKMFRSGGTVQGVLGMLCIIWAFGWGWVNAGKEGLRNVMLGWTALIALAILFSVLGGLKSNGREIRTTTGKPGAVFVPAGGTLNIYNRTGSTAASSNSGL